MLGRPNCVVEVLRHLHCDKRQKFRNESSGWGFYELVADVTQPEALQSTPSRADNFKQRNYISETISGESEKFISAQVEARARIHFEVSAPGEKFSFLREVLMMLRYGHVSTPLSKCFFNVLPLRRGTGIFAFL